MNRLLTDLANFRKMARRRRVSLAALFHEMLEREIEATIRQSMDERPAASLCPFCQQVQPPDHVCVKPEDREEGGAVEAVRRAGA